MSSKILIFCAVLIAATANSVVAARLPVDSFLWNRIESFPWNPPTGLTDGINDIQTIAQMTNPGGMGGTISNGMDPIKKIMEMMGLGANAVENNPMRSMFGTVVNAGR